jgi:2-(1,2-epoxy-1,2-dihydrophenyl)acetyl-CoA isomerase
MVAGSAAVRCIVLTGAGRAFCAGADVGLLKEIQERKDVATGRRIVDGARAIYRVIREADQPVLCSQNGVAAGGGAGLALGCDLRIAANTAQMGQVFGKIGLHPDWGATYFLPRMVGTARAMELFLSADLVPAPRLLELGLVNRVVPAAQLESQTKSWAQQIAAAPPQAVRLMKRNVYKSERASLDDMLDAELEAQLACFVTADCAEGLAAFFAKRTPQFTGR